MLLPSLSGGAVCTANTQADLTITASPTASAGADQSFCFGNPPSVALGGSPSGSGGVGGYQYTWTILAGATPAELSSLLVANPIYTPAAPNAPAGASFALVVKDLNNCASAADTVTVLAADPGNTSDEGNILRATKTGPAASDVTLAWTALDPFAITFNVRRDTVAAFTSNTLIATGLVAAPHTNANDVPIGAGTQLYVYARELGKPGGHADMTTCATDPTTGEEVCSNETLVLVRNTGEPGMRVRFRREAGLQAIRRGAGRDTAATPRHQTRDGRRWLKGPWPTRGT